MGKTLCSKIWIAANNLSACAQRTGKEAIAAKPRKKYEAAIQHVGTKSPADGHRQAIWSRGGNMFCYGRGRQLKAGLSNCLIAQGSRCRLPCARTVQSNVSAFVTRVTTSAAEEYDEEQEEEQQAAVVFEQTAVAEQDHEQQEEEQKRITIVLNARTGDISIAVAIEQAVEDTHGKNLLFQISDAQYALPKPCVSAQELPRCRKGDNRMQS